MGEQQFLTPTVVQWVVAAVPSVLGFLAIRMITGIDKKIDALNNAVSTMQIEMGKLQIKVATLEIYVFQGRTIPPPPISGPVTPPVLP